jgi:ABC-type nitrate/sulfonate/bicarbonate transport system ATPase subunit
MLSIRDVSSCSRDGRLRFLDHISLDLEDGEVVGLFGPSGCGKSSLLETVIALKAKTEGEIRVNGSSDLTVRAALRHIAFLPQDSSDFLLPWRTVSGNLLAYGPDHRESFRSASLTGALNKVGLLERSKEFPQALSGGEKRRLVFAAVLRLGRPILLLDEPFSGLDLDLRFRLWDLLHCWRKSTQNHSALLITHSLEEAAVVCDRVLFFKRSSRGMKLAVQSKSRHSFFVAKEDDPVTLFRCRREWTEYQAHLDSCLEEALRT